MSFQGYLDTIEKKTGKSPAEPRRHAEAKGWLEGGMLRADVKAGVVIADLKEKLGLGHGYAMAVVALLEGTKQEGDA